MATFHGMNGSVSWIDSTAVDTVTSWSVTTSADMAEITSMETASAGYKTYISGFKDWNATVEAIVDHGGLYPAVSTAGVEDRDGATLILHGGTTATARKYTGTAICTGITPTVDLNDAIRVTYKFEGNGELAEATDA